MAPPGRDITRVTNRRSRMQAERGGGQRVIIIDSECAKIPGSVAVAADRAAAAARVAVAVAAAVAAAAAVATAATAATNFVIAEPEPDLSNLVVPLSACPLRNLGPIQNGANGRRRRNGPQKRPPAPGCRTPTVNKRP